MKVIYRDFEHYWREGKHGWTSASIDLARETWEDFEPTITASRDDYKNAYVALMNERAEKNSDLVTALLDYVKEHVKEDSPNFWRWYLDQEMAKP